MRKLLLLAAAGVLLAACASPGHAPLPPDTVIHAGFAAPPAGARIVLLPAAGEDRELARGESLLTAELAQALQQAGYRVAQLDAANHAELWRQEAEAAGGVFDPVTGAAKPLAQTLALSRLARRVCAEASCALLLRHRLVTRRAELDRRVARWDGQQRPVPYVSTGGDRWNHSGDTTGLSVELLALTAGGELAFRSYGGASLPYAVDVAGQRLVLRTDLFDDPAELRAGLRVALAPLLQAPRTTTALNCPATATPGCSGAPAP